LAYGELQNDAFVSLRRVGGEACFAAAINSPAMTLPFHFLRRLGAAILLTLPVAALAQTPGVGIGTTAPDASAALDIVSSSKGALLPRVADATAIATPATGLLVFQTGTPAGFYYNAGTPTAPSWQQLATASGAAVTATNGLTKTGAAIGLGGTLTQATTIDQGSNDLLLTGTGNVGVGQAAPTARLDVASSLRVTSTTAIGGAQLSQPNLIGGVSGLNGQSFTLPVGTTIRAIDVFVFSGTGTFSVYKGEPGASAPLVSQPVTYTPGYGRTTVVLATPIVVTSPGVYSFTTGGSDYVSFSSPSVYAGGQAYGGTTASPNDDLKFNVRYDGQNEATLYAAPSGYVGIGTASPTATLDVAGSTRLRGLTTPGVVTTDANGNLSSGTAATTFGSDFIQNQNATDQSANFRISGNGYLGGNVGIGTSNPLTRLSISPGTNEPKITLWDGGNATNHYGLGTSNGQLNYHIDGTGSNHVFYAGGKNGDGTELLRIKGDGNVGIGTSSPTQKLDVAGNANVRGNTNVTGGLYVDAANANDGTFTGGSPLKGVVFGSAGSGEGIGANRAGGPNGFGVDIYTNFTPRLSVGNNGNVGIGTTAPTATLDVNGSTRLRGLTTPGVVTTDASGNLSSSPAPSGTDFIQNQAGTDQAANFRISGNGYVAGNVGIGTTTPNAPLQLASTLANRKLVLYETANNDHEFLGFGINNNTLRYQVANAGDSHVFFRGNGPAASVELMRIKGDGNVGIGTTNPGQKLDVAGNVNVTGTLQLNTADTDKLFYTLAGAAGSKLGHAAGWGVLNYAGPGTGGPTGYHSWLTTGASAYAERMRLTEAGLGIGTDAPTATLDVAGSTRLRGLTTAGLVVADANGNLSSSTSLPAGVTGDNLGNHSATQNLALNDYDLRLRTAGDTNHGLGWYGGSKPWNGVSVDGPVLYGAGGGVLGIAAGQQSVLTWNNGGNVGIGTSSPDRKLTVVGNASAIEPLLLLRNSAGGAGNGAALDFQNYDPGTNPSSARIQSIDDGFYGGNLAFLTKPFGANTNALTERLRISPLGNVGIGTTNPGQKLEVAGSIKISGSGSGLTFADGTTQTTAAVAPDLTGDITSTGTATTYNNIVPATKGGAGTVNGLLKADGSGLVSAAVAGTDYAAATGSAAYVQNQTSTDQAGGFRVAGAGTVGGLLMASGGATVTGGLLTANGGATVTGTTSINTSGTATTNIGTGSTSGTVTIGRVAGSTSIIGPLTATGNINLNVNTTGATTNIGTGTGSGAVTIGRSGGVVMVPALTTAGVVTTDASGTLSSSSATAAFGTSFIQNQTSTNQPAAFRLGGNGLLAGRLGVGSLAPKAKLELQGGADNNGASDSVALAFAYRSGGYRHFVRSRHNAGVTGAGNDLDFYLNNSTTAAGSSAPGAGNVQVLTLENNNGAARVGVGTSTPAAALDVVGDVRVPATNNYTYAAPRTKSLMLGSFDFKAENGATGTTLDGATDELYPTNGTTPLFRAPLHLPQGAVITGITLLGYDGNAANLTAELLSYTATSGGASRTTLATAATTGAPNYATVNSPTIAATVDNDNSTYSVRVTFGAVNVNTLTLRGVRVNYTITKVE
jgi:hypothetical protein